MTTGRFLIVLAVLAAAGMAPAGPKDTPKPTGEKITFKHWAVPGRYLMTMKMNMNQDITVDGAVQPRQRMLQEMTMLLVVGRPDAEGLRTIDMSYERMQQTTTMGEMKVSFDSNLPVGKQDLRLATALAPMLKVKIRVVLDAAGKVVKVSGIDKLWDDLVKSNPAMAPMAEQMKKQMGNLLVKQLIAKGQELLPAAGVRVGESWETSGKMTIPFVGPVNVVQQCKLKSVAKTKAGRIAYIDYKGRMTSKT
ncbi:hypothetical protein LCGC14_2367510, partial [marine sediment metagenome]